MLSKIKQSWKVKDVRRRILYTLMMILIFRIGTTIPVPGVDTSIISKLVSGNSLLALYNMFTGGAFSNFTLFALGIGPYITASIIIQLLTVGFESLKELQKSGEEGRFRLSFHPGHQGFGRAKMDHEAARGRKGIQHPHQRSGRCQTSFPDGVQ